MVRVSASTAKVPTTVHSTQLHNRIIVLPLHGADRPIQRREADDALATRTFARDRKSSTNLMVSEPGNADFGPKNDLQVGKRELRTDQKI